MTNIQIKVKDLSGRVHNISVPADMNLNLMEAIRLNEIPVKATCGGMAMCATCHVRILSDHDLPEMSESEEAMLDEAFVLDDPGSRLSCQIRITKALEGLDVEMGVLTGD